MTVTKRAQGWRIAASAIVLSASAAATNRWYVDDDAALHGDGASWATAFRSLDEALAASAQFDEIWVARGRYLPRQRKDPADPRSASFVFGGHKSLFGGFAGDESALSDRAGFFAETVLDGDLGVTGYAGDDAYHVITLHGKMRVDGFAVVHGNANGPLSASRGGAVLAEAGLGNQVFFRRTIFADNRAAEGGVLHAQNSVLWFAECRFTRNHAVTLGGAFRVQAASVYCVDSVFRGNSATQGGALSLSSIQWSPIAVRIAGCVFAENRAELGGAAYLGAAQITSGAALFGNSTFWRNQASDTGGAIYAKTDTAHPAVSVLANCIVWENTAATAPGLFGAQFPSWSIVQGNGALGNHNFELDPLFVDPVNGDFRLAPGSPAIDSGANPSVLEDFADLDEDGDTLEPCPFALDGLPRFVDDPSTPDTGVGPGPIVDRGATER
jgi:predicted outer membrane repeat protein